MEPVKITDIDELDVSEDGHGDLLLDGRLFSGIAYERNESGPLISLVGVERGYKHGPWRAWYPDGKLQPEHFYHAGGNNGPWREWSPSGSLLVDDYWQCGVLVCRSRPAPALRTPAPMIGLRSR